MELNGAAIVAAATGYRALFTQGWESADPTHPMYVMETDSNGDTEVYHFDDSLPEMREWLGDRQVKGLPRFTITLQNREYELTIGIPRKSFEDDTLGLHNPRIRMMGLQARNHPDKLLADLLNNGFSDLAYDDEAFFSTDHDFGSNRVSGALSASTFEEAIQQMRQLTDHEGNAPIDVFSLGGELELMVAPDLEATAEAILKAKELSGGGTNTNYGKAKLRVNARLTAGYWFLTMTGTPLAPFIFQKRRDAQFVAMDQPDSESVYRRKTVEFGVDGRWAMGYGFPQLIQGSNGS